MEEFDADLKRKVDEQIAASGKKVRPDEIKKEIQLLKRSDVLKIVMAVIEQYGKLENKDLIAKLAEMEINQGRSAKRVRELQEAIEALRAQHGRLVVDHEEAARRLASAEARATDLGCELGRRAQVSQDDVKALQEALEGAKREATALREKAARLASAEARAADLERELGHRAQVSQDDVQALREALEGAKREAAALKTAQREKDATLSALRNDLQGGERELALLRPLVERLKGELQRAQEGVSTAERNRIELEAEREKSGKLGEQIRILERERDDARAKESGLLKEVESSRDALRRAEAEYRANLDRAGKQLDEARARLAPLEKSERELRARVEALTRELTTVKEDYERRLAQLREQMLGLELALDQFALVPEFDFARALVEAGADASRRKRLESNRERFQQLIRRMDSGEGSIGVITELREALAESRGLTGE